MFQSQLPALVSMIFTMLLASGTASSADLDPQPLAAASQVSSAPSTMVLSTIFECAFALIILILLWKSAYAIRDFVVRQYRSIFAASSLEAWPKNLAEEEELSKLAIGAAPASESKTLKVEPVDKVAAPARQDASNAGAVISTRAVLDDFSSDAPATFSNLANLCGKIKNKTKEADLREELTSICVELQNLKASSAVSQMRLVWQMTRALEGLLKQLDNRITCVTLSSLRTVRKGVELLDELCSTQAASDAFTTPAIRVLGVDDDAISRYALSWAIKKAFDQVDVVENGEAALKLANLHAYDVIFLDIRMPGMDGFELCANIRETSLNHVTPIVFVTGLRDFGSRLETVTKENDLIAKPFLGFEITVKVLTLALRKRLDELKAPV